MIIDMHAHWRPPSLLPLLRERTEMPLVETNDEGVEVFKSVRGTVPVSTSFDNLDKRLVEMDRTGVSTQVFSLWGAFTWIERLPVEEAIKFTRVYNDSVSEICTDHPGRFAAYASVPLEDKAIAAQELERALELPGIIGVALPGNGFLTYEDAQAYRPIFEVANRHKALVLIHWGPAPGDKWPRVPRDADNMMHRWGTLDMQASLSSNVITLCLTDFLDDFPDARIHVHNLGGNIPFEIARLDHRNVLDKTDDVPPSQRMRRDNFYVDCNSFDALTIALGIKAYGADKIVVGTDGSEISCNMLKKELEDAKIDPKDRQAILYDNAERMLSHLTTLAPPREAAA